MLLKNESNKIIGITVNMSILPGETGECPKGYEDNPVIKKYIANGTFTDVSGGEAGSPVTVSAGAGDPAGAGKALSEMSKEELLAYASENGIDTGNATTKDGILKKIQDAQKAG